MRRNWKASLPTVLSNRPRKTGVSAKANMKWDWKPFPIITEGQALWQQAYETKVNAHFQLYLNYVAYLKAAGILYNKINL